MHDADLLRHPGDRRANTGCVRRHLVRSARKREMEMRHRRDLAARSGGSGHVGKTRMAFTVRAAVRGLAAVPERRKIARISSRPAAGAFRSHARARLALISSTSPAVTNLVAIFWAAAAPFRLGGAAERSMTNAEVGWTREVD
jgi:hypothetical protein